MPKKNLLIVTALILGLGLLSWFWLGFNAEETRGVQPSPNATTGGRQASVTPEHELAQTPSGDTEGVVRADTAPLPAAGTPLVEMLDELRRRAESGNVHASCRLGMELYRCSQLELQQSKLREAQRFQNLSDSTRLMANVAQLEQSCGVLAETAALDYPGWLLKAALSGHLGAKSRYVKDDHYLVRAAIQRPELVQQYLQNAPKLLTELTVLGQPDLLQTFASALVESDSQAPSQQQAQTQTAWLALAVPYDPVLARTYMQTLARVRQMQLQGIELSNDPARREGEIRAIQEIAFTGENQAALTRFDQNLSVEQIKTSDAAVISLMQARAQAEAEFASKITAADMHRLMTTAENDQTSDWKIANSADANMCDLGTY